MRFSALRVIALVMVPGFAHAAETVYAINGTFGSNEHSCTQITHVLGGADCSYGRNWPGAALEADGTTPGWFGPTFGGGHYALGSPGDALSYIPTSGSYTGIGTVFTPAVDDGKIAAPITGTFTINDNDTPSDPTDDLISGAFSIGALARNIATGQSSRVVQRWTSMDHVMAATAVNAAATVANGAGGVDYVIGSRGFPARVCNRADSADCFSTPNANGVVTGSYDGDFPVSFWTPIPPNSIGIERSGQLGDPGWATASPRPPANPPTGNVGATTDATFTGYECLATIPTDCSTSAIVWGAGETPGFDNLVMKISTNAAGAITSAQVYWTQEYFIGAFGAIAGYDNSWQGGTFTFASPGQGQYAVDDAVATEQDQSIEIDVLANDNGLVASVYVGIWTDPANGTAAVSGAPGAPSGIRVTYTPDPGFVGQDSFEYWLESGLAVDYGLVTVDVLTSDTDGDGVVNSLDNCIEVSNASQCDSDGDGYGNRCDGDLTNNGFTNAQDTVVLRGQLGKPSVGPTFNKADLNCNGFVNAQDTVLFRQLLGKPPGPSGLH